MKDEDKTKEQLINELLELRQHISKIQASEINRKDTEKALQKSEERFRQIAESSGEFIWEVDVNGLYTYANPVIEEILGYNPDEIIGKKHFYDFFHPDVKDTLTKAAFEVFAEKKRFKYFFNPNIHKNGNTVIFETSGLPVIDDKGTLLGYRGSDRDVTERRKAEDELLGSEEKFRTVADFTYDWEWWKDPQGYYKYVSPSCERITGYRPEEFFADPDLIVKITHPDDRPTITNHFNKSFQNDTDVYHLDYRIISRSGEVRWISHYCQPINNKEGIYLGRRGSNRDITKGKHTEEQIQQLNNELEQKIVQLTGINQALDLFNRSVSHDLQAPLIVVGGFAGRLLKIYGDTLETDAIDMINTIQMSAHKMERLIKDLLAFSRSARQEIKSVKINMTNLIGTVIDELKPLSEGRTVKFDIKTLAPAFGDIGLIKQVLTNLLSNAIKFTNTKEIAIVEVGCRVEETENIYYAKDNGIGFDSQHADKLFAPFNRLPEAKEFEGTGIGLSIVERIINRHGGRVWAEGKFNEGAVFYFTLPAINR